MAEKTLNKNKIKLNIDKEKCKGCGLCIIFCPKKALKISKALNKKGMRFVELEQGYVCTGCLSCAVMCPECAIEIYQTEK